LVNIVENVTALPLAELADIAATLAAAAPVDIPPGPGRRWAKVAETETHEAWVIAWPPGAGLPMHHHGGAAGAIQMLQGELAERHLVDGTMVERVLGPGRPVTMPPDHVHQVANLDLTEAVSVHVYSPPGSQAEFIG
jgi:hypothetical protein